MTVPEWAVKNKKKLPVVAFIHGGAFGFGSNRDDMVSLASQGMVGISINYRLGPYGFLYLENKEEGEKYKGNWGLQERF